MIPTFPEFKKLELADKKDVEKFTAKFTPYADFNFSNMWAWDLKGEMKFSILNDNLVVKFTDYLTGEPFYSFLGKNMVNETARALIMLSEKDCKTDILKLIPEVVIDSLDKSEFDIIPDKDSFEYVYSVQRMAKMNAWPKSTISKNIRRFIEEDLNFVVKHNLINEISKDEYLKMFQKWSENKNIKNYKELNEYRAFERFFKLKNDNIRIISLYKNDFLIGFDVYEMCSFGYALSHFSKIDTSQYHALSTILNWEEAKFLDMEKIQYINWQQDLGILGLRKSKMKYKPDLFLNKFFIKKLK